MAKRAIRKASDPITLKDLGEFTEQVILPGVEGVVEKVFDEKFDEKIKPLREDIKTGFVDVAKSIRALSGDIAEIKENQKEAKEKNELRFLRLENKEGVQNC